MRILDLQLVIAGHRIIKHQPSTNPFQSRPLVLLTMLAAPCHKELDHAYACICMHLNTHRWPGVHGLYIAIYISALFNVCDTCRKVYMCVPPFLVCIVRLTVSVNCFSKHIPL